MTSAPIVDFDSVSLTFADGTEALREATLSVEPGEFVSLLGPSGCGKSTLLRIAAGLTDYGGGALRVDRSRLAFTFQDATLLPWRTLQANVELLLELRGVSPEGRRRAAREKIDLVGLAGFERHYPKHLSAGMKMRASLARALTLEPALFLFDEPFAALDEITRERLNDEVLALHARQGFAALFVTHSIAEAVYLSRRVLVMSRRPGRIVAAQEIPFAYPRDPAIRYTAEFAQLCGALARALRAASES